ncbi:MAG: hypothetical protein AB7R89_21195 [Dehalococcoidia bacterium]
MRFFRIGLIALLTGTVAGLLATDARAQPTTIVVPLVPGWNNVAYMGPSAAIADVLAPVSGRYQTVWEFDSQRQAFRAYDPRVPIASDLKDLTTQRAFWILMQQPATLTYQAQPANGMLTLYPGLNNIVYIGQEAPLAEVLAPVMGRVAGVWRWDPAIQRWQGAVPGTPLASEFATMAPGRAYSVQIAAGNTVALHGPEVSRPATAARQECHSFQARQPELAELRTAFNKAGFGALISDAGFALPRLETEAAGDGGAVAAYIPPTLLKAISWAETSWRHAGYEVQRGMNGRTLTSTSCAFGVMQVLTDMDIEGQPNARQELVGSDYRYNIAAGARILGEKWNLAPAIIPVVKPRNPATLEDWYYAVWAYHCYGERCTELGLHDNPDDPTLPWPRPAYNSPEQLSSRGQYTRSDYPYQELVYGLIQHPPRADGTPIWRPLPVTLPPKGSVSHPEPKGFERSGTTLDPTRADDP